MLNYFADTLIGASEAALIVVMGTNHLVLGYMLGAHARDEDRDFLYVYLPGMIYTVLSLSTLLLPTQDRVKDPHFLYGAKLGILFHTCVIELGPHIVEDDRTWVTGTALGMWCISIGIHKVLDGLEPD
jgi:vacuolar-type H+-ATPase subunit I/STV1